MSDPNSNAPDPQASAAQRPPQAPQTAGAPAGSAPIAQAPPAAPGTQPAPGAPVAPPAPHAQGAAVAPAPGRQPRPAKAPKAPKPPRAAKEKGGLSTFLKVSIILLAGLTIASISLLFVGEFEGKFERVFSTFVLFAVFVLFTALDTRREQKSEWYAPVALIANAYILGLLLIVIWMSKYDPFGLLWEIFWKSLLVIVVTRAVILCCQLLLQAGQKLPPVVTTFAFITSILAVLSGILFTAPVGIEAFDLRVPDLYWKIATAILILTALGLSITLLLRWSYGAEGRERARQARAAQQAAQQQAFAANAQQGYALQQGYPAQQAQPQQVQQQPAPQQPVQQQPAQDEGELLPWPTFPDGRPLPMGPDGQPDFSALQQGQQPPTER